MVVLDGRYGGRGSWVSSSLALCSCVAIVSALGCGSRSLSADPDIYNPDETGDDIGVTPGAGGTSGKPVPGGKGGSTTTPPIGAGGKGGSGAAPSTASANACREYCKGYKTTCAELLGGRDCQASCTGEVDGSGSACQKLGVEALTCLAPYLSYANLGCDGTLALAVATCSEPLAQFQRCKGNSQPMPGPPTPQPGPTPTPPPMPSCSGGSGWGDNASCSMSWNCSDGPYLAQCMNGGASSSCVCVWPTGITRNLDIAFSSVESACQTASRACAFPFN